MRQLSLFEREEDSTGIEEEAPEVVKNAWKKAKQYAYVKNHEGGD